MYFAESPRPVSSAIVQTTACDVSGEKAISVTVTSATFRQSIRWPIYIGVRTDPGKVWKVLEFNVEIFKASKRL